MANTASAKKMVRKIERRTLINKMRRTRIRTFIRKVREAVESKNKEQALMNFKSAQPEIHRGVTKGILKKNTAGRILSRLSASIKKLEGPALLNLNNQA